MKATFEDAAAAAKPVSGTEVASTPTPVPAPADQVASTPTPATSTAVVPATSTAVTAYVADNEVEGEFDASDRERARLTVVAKTGKLSNVFTPGDILLNTEHVIGTVKQPLVVIPVSYKKLYQNDLDFDGGEMGDTVKSATEVLDRGGIVDYRPYEEKKATHYWKKVLQVIFLVQRPENLGPEAASMFPYAVEGNDYALVGFWASARSAYSGIAVPLINSKLKGSIRRFTYNLSTKGEQNRDGSRTWIQTNLRVSGPTSDALTAFLKEIAG